MYFNFEKKMVEHQKWVFTYKEIYIGSTPSLEVEKQLDKVIEMCLEKPNLMAWKIGKQNVSCHWSTDLYSHSILTRKYVWKYLLLDSI